MLSSCAVFAMICGVPHRAIAKPSTPTPKKQSPIPMVVVRDIIERPDLNTPASNTKIPMPAHPVRTTLAGLDKQALGHALKVLGVPERQIRMRTNQLWTWIYARGAQTFDDMTDVSKDLRAKLAEHHTLDRLEIVSEQVSADGTRKWLLRLPIRGHELKAPEIETV
ncbi:MAG: hypothetical protein AAFO75_02840, partial [Pseudomonadota bacterium]